MQHASLSMECWNVPTDLFAIQFNVVDKLIYVNVRVCLCSMHLQVIERVRQYFAIHRVAECEYLSRTTREIDPDTAHVVCISVWLGFPYVISVFPCFPYMVSLFPCFPSLVMMHKLLKVKAILLDRALLWAAINAALSQGPLLWRHTDKTVIVSWNLRGPEREPLRGDRGPPIDQLLVGLQSNL